MMFASFLELNTVTLRTTKVLETEKTVKVEEKTSSNKKRKTISSESNKKTNVVKPKKAKREKIKFDGDDIERRIRQVLIKEGVDEFTIELLVAQSKHESGEYKNSLTEFNNVFARHYFRADTFAISAGATAEGHSRFSKYPSVEYATLSQLWYFRRKHYSFKWKSIYEFAVECKRKGYYEAPVSVYYQALLRYYTGSEKNI